MKLMFLVVLLAEILAAPLSAMAGLLRVKAELTFAPEVPPPITRHEPAIVEVGLTATRKVLPLMSWAKYNFWTFNEHVPGPFIRARAGDWLEVHIANTDTNGMPHNVDFHAATGPGGGSLLLTVAPGERHTAWLRLRNPGLFLYHCAVPPIVDHIANGMFGLLLVEPTNGLPHADREFYVMQSECYVVDAAASSAVLEYSHDHAVEERPRFVVFNGSVGALLGPDALKAKTGERVRLYFGDAGPNLISSFHIIGTVLEDVCREGGLTDPPAHDLQTTLVSPGAATIAEFTPLVPGTYSFVDHAMGRAEKGALGEIEVSGPVQADVYRSEQDGPPAQ